MSEFPKRFVPCSHDVIVPSFLLASDGSRLELAEGSVDFSFSFGFLHRDEDEAIDHLLSVVRISDSTGAVWEARVPWSPADIILQAGALAALEPPVFESDAEPSWREALASGLLVSGSRTLLDDRFIRPLVISGKLFSIQMKYQGPRLDLGMEPDPMGIGLNRMIGRVTGMHEASNWDEIPPFLFEVDYLHGLFTVRLEEEEEHVWVEAPFPRPAIFRLTDLTGEPQPNVIFNKVG